MNLQTDLQVLYGEWGLESTHSKASILFLSLNAIVYQLAVASLFEGKNFMKLFMALAENQRKLSEALTKVTGKSFDIALPAGTTSSLA